MDEKKVFDVSCFMLMEATGDSEADSGLNLESDINALAEDDAQSCCCDVLDYGSTVEFGDDLGHAHGEDCHVDDDMEEGIHNLDWSDDDDDDVVLSRIAKAEGQHRKSKVCVDSAMALKNEMEKSRLFWEACLAS
ncbi:uncharacterized protein LOC127814237 [Diospyros lotus]|uniref:uncharacterized protein LOC127814237 n=1 Tax=Diospyros lotus TaxID=55363 RepID=UPI00225AE475|nr:uncharacterized protein LOC127814237 [Diospyros lotus]